MRSSSGYLFTPHPPQAVLAAVRSRFGSCVINAIHYRNATSLPHKGRFGVSEPEGEIGGTVGDGEDILNYDQIQRQAFATLQSKSAPPFSECAFCIFRPDHLIGSSGLSQSDVILIRDYFRSCRPCRRYNIRYNSVSNHQSETFL